MKANFIHFYFIKIAKSILTFCAVLCMTMNVHAQLTFTEDFENETTPSGSALHTFSESGISFSSQLTFASLPAGFGFGASTNYIYLLNSTNGVAQSATISITAGNPAFRVNSFAAYVSSDQFGSTTTNGSITFVGTLLGGGTATAIVNIPSTGLVLPPLTREANEVVNGLSFTGTPLDGKLITSLKVQTSATVQFVLLDHINFTVDNTPPTITCPVDVTICGPTIVPAVNIGSVTTTDNFSGTVTVTHQGDVSTPSTTVPYTILRTYRATDVSGNFAECTQTITVNPVPIATASSNSPVCEGNSLILTGGGNGTYSWTSSNGFTSISQNPTITATVSLTGTYTITVTNAGCTSTASVAVTVNPNPATPTITDAGTAFCSGVSTTLSAPVIANCTYAWQRSLTGIANPNSFTAFGGTAQTQVVTTSGVYRVVVTNQYNCSSRDTTAVKFGDFVFSGSLATGDAQQTGRMNRFGVVSTCAAPKSYPIDFTTTGSRFYDSYTVTNPTNAPVCATIGITSGCGTTIFCAAYLGSFNPTSLGTNYLADPGSSFLGTGFYEATIPANGTMIVVVHELNPGVGCSNYNLRVDVPREALSITVTPNIPVSAGTPVSLKASAANTYAWAGGPTTQTFNLNAPAITTTYNVTLGYGNSICTATTSAQVVAKKTTVMSIASGNWETASTWENSQVPELDVNAIISANHTVTVTTPNARAKNLEYKTGVILRYLAGGLLRFGL